MSNVVFWHLTILRRTVLSEESTFDNALKLLNFALLTVSLAEKLAFLLLCCKLCCPLACLYCSSFKHWTCQVLLLMLYLFCPFQHIANVFQSLEILWLVVWNALLYSCIHQRDGSDRGSTLSGLSINRSDDGSIFSHATWHSALWAKH